MSSQMSYIVIDYSILCDKISNVNQLLHKYYLRCKMNDLIADLENTICEKNISFEDASKFVGCSSVQIYRWIRRQSIPTLIYRQAISKAIKKMEKLPSVNLAKSDRDLYKKLKSKITLQEKEWLFEHLENYSIYQKRLKELESKYSTEKE